MSDDDNDSDEFIGAFGEHDSNSSDSDDSPHYYSEVEFSSDSDVDSDSDDDHNDPHMNMDRSDGSDVSEASFISTALLQPVDKLEESKFADEEDAEAFRGVWRHHYRKVIRPLKYGDASFFNYTFHCLLNDIGKSRLASFVARANHLIQVNVTLTEQHPQSVGLVFQEPFRQDHVHALRRFKLRFPLGDAGEKKARMPLDDWKCISRYLGKCPYLCHLEISHLSLGKEELEQLTSALEKVKLKTLGLFSLDVRGEDSTLGLLFSSMNSTELETIDMVSCNAGVSACEGLASILANEMSKLECLNLGSNVIDDNCVRVLCASLAKNSSLKILQLQNNETITEEGWVLFEKLVFDATNPESLYGSNHTLHNVSGHPRPKLFQYNSRYSTHQSHRLGRAKILICLTNDCADYFNIALLNHFEVEMMPYVLEVFATRNRKHVVFPDLHFCYQIIRRWKMPELFSFPSAEKFRLSVHTDELKQQILDLRNEMEQMKEENLRLKSENRHLKSEHQLRDEGTQHNSKRTRFD